MNLALVAGGLLLLVLGARWLVDAAIDTARLLGLGERVVGLTVVALGTSLPEIATSAVAVLRGERDLAVGNVVGSNILNLSAVLGLAAASAPGGLPVNPGALHFDLPVMVATALACLPIFLTGQRIGRAEGVLFLAYYAAYVGYLLLDAADHAVLPAYGWAMRHVVIPLAALTLVALAAGALRRRPRPGR